MKPLRDPEQAELRHLVEVCQLQGKVVLEIGCGDGGFTRQYAHLTNRVVGIDPLLTEVKLAKKRNQLAKYRKMHFLLGEAQTLPFPNQTFDVVIFASSL
ncbi:MAG TPA: class I SAM-dependent methyltransferase [Anaerolineales bacterium]|nr:class I SAM-dependent methyltransferase [Anaerolineales bacterium]